MEAGFCGQRITLLSWLVRASGMKGVPMDLLALNRALLVPVGRLADGARPSTFACLKVVERCLHAIAKAEAGYRRIKDYSRWREYLPRFYVPRVY